MSSEIMHQILQAIEEEVNSRPSAIEFEMAYQARVAIDRIRFAIKHTEQFCPRSDQLREAGLSIPKRNMRLKTETGKGRRSSHETASVLWTRSSGRSTAERVCANDIHSDPAGISGWWRESCGWSAVDRT